LQEICELDNLKGRQLENLIELGEPERNSVAYFAKPQLLKLGKQIITITGMIQFLPTSDSSSLLVSNFKFK
jgi:hypothetical protein